MQMLVFQRFGCFVGSPHLGPLPGLLLASCWPLAGVLLASCWPLPGFLLASPPEHAARAFLASCWLPCQSIPLENRFFILFMQMLAFQWFRCFVESLPFGASSWPLAVAGLLLASSWLLAGFPARTSRQKIVFQKAPKTSEFSS